MRYLFLLTFYLILIIPCIAQNKKTFIREYVYKASETDSKVSSRQKALNEVRSLLINELGTYVENYVNYEMVEENDRITKDFFTSEIKTLSVGTTETKILEEKWDGYEYYVKAEIIADPEEVIRRINQTLSFRKSSQAIDSLKLLLEISKKEFTIQSNELNTMRNQLEVQNREVTSKQISLIMLNSKLSKAKQQLHMFQIEEDKILTELEQIEETIKKSTGKAFSNVREGMTSIEVIQVCGSPRSQDKCTNQIGFNYGQVWVVFFNNIATALVENKIYEGACYPANGYRENNHIK